jgi:chromosome segregation ATPase
MARYPAILAALLGLALAAPVAAERRSAAGGDGAAARMQALVSQVSTERDAARAAQQRAEQAPAESQKELEQARGELAGAEAQNTKLREAIGAFEAQNLALRTRLGEGAQALAALDGTHRAQGEQLKKSQAGRQELARERETCLARVSTLEGHNVELVHIGMELLDRYAGKGLGEVLGAREPVTGALRVRMENLVQDYRFRIEDEAVARDAAAGKPATP